MKLGSLLLKGFRSKKSKKSKKRSKYISKPSVKPVTKGVRPSQSLRSAVVYASKSKSSVITIQSADLIRPNERLRRSIEAFLLDQRSEHTRRAYGKDLKRLVQFLIDRKLRVGVEEINRAMIVAYKDQLLSESLEHTTVDRHLASLRSFFRWLVEDGVLEKNPAENVRFLNPKRESRTNGFTDAEVLKILALPNLRLKSGSMHYAILMILFYCGLRRSELCGIRTTQLGFEREHHFMRLRGKGNHERIVVLVAPVWNAIQHYVKMTFKALDHDQFLFTPVRNNRTAVYSKALDPSMIFYIVKKYAKAAGVTHRVSPHSCRATAISNARDHRVSDRAIQEFAGWSSPSMITRYDKRKSALENAAVHHISYDEAGASSMTTEGAEPTLNEGLD